MDIGSLANYLGTLLQVSQFDESAYNGIQITNTGTIKHIATAVSSSLQVLEKAVEAGAQAVIVHHGLFRKTDKHPLVDLEYKKIKLLLDHNIALLCYHLPLDAHMQFGNNYKAAYDLGLFDLQPFAEYKGNMIGVIGTMHEIPFQELKKKAEVYYQHNAMAVEVKTEVTKIAILSGGGDKFLYDAAKAGADCLITGRADEPVWDIAHEKNISFLALGHYATETIGVQALGKHLQEKFDFLHTFIKTNNPF